MEFKEIDMRNRDKEVVGIARVSPEDYDNVSKYSWYMQTRKKKNGFLAYAIGRVGGQNIMMHHFIMGKLPNEGFVIDHINNDGLDNRRVNLRFVSTSANCQNVQKKEDAKHKYIGVSKSGKNLKYIVRQGGISLGTFDDEIEAAKHYDKYVTIKYNGAGKTNFPVSPEDIDGLTLDDLLLMKPLERDLPMHIRYNKSRMSYFAERIYNGNTYRTKHSKTLKETVVELSKINLLIDELQDKSTKEHYEQPIDRNSRNQAIIILKSKKKGEVAECIVDDELWHDLKLYTWYMSKAGYAQAGISGTNILMHRYLMAKTHDKIDIIDHINNNPLDNRMSNLRSVCAATNNHNRKKKEGCTSKYIGVYKLGEIWRAAISINHKPKALGNFKNEIDAARAYNEKAIELYGDHANLNVLE